MPLLSSGVFLELHVPHFQRAIDFYTLFGFKVVYADASFITLQSGKSMLSFSGGSKRISQHSYFGGFPQSKRGYGVEIVVFVRNVTRLYKKVKGKVKIVASLQLRPWKKKDFRVEDPFGFYLRFTEPDDWENKQGRAQTKKVLQQLGLKG